MRNMMVISFLIYCATAAILVPWLGNHGLWLALEVFLGVRGLSLLARLPGKAAQTFNPT